MMKAAVIENGVVTHLWEVPALDCYGDLYVLVEAPDWVILGASWDDQKFTNPINPHVKSDKWEEIKAERDRRTEQGGYKVGTKWFHSDQKSRSQQLGLVLLGANIPANLQWKTMDGSFVTMTAALAQQLLAAAAASDQAIFAAAEAHRQAMEASADPAAYDFSTGWPKVFGE